MTLRGFQNVSERITPQRTYKNIGRLRTAALLLSAVAFSFAAVPNLLKKLPSDVLDGISYCVKGDFSFGKAGLPSGVENEIVLQTETVSDDGQTSDLTDETVQTGSESEINETESNIKTVQAVNLARYAQNETPKMYLMNETDYKADLKEFAEKTYEFKKISGAGPTVLVIHTHGTESYMPDGVDTYDNDTKYRSTDSAYNVVGIGDAFCEELEKHGIITVHDVTMHDIEDFNAAYTSSRNAMKKYLEEYPSILYIIDIHRDSVFTEDRTNQKPIVYINGEATAQIMTVVGTDFAGASHSGWMTNLTLAAKLQVKFNDYPAFARPVYLRKASYNQQLSKGALLIEIGSCGNTVEEARRAAVLAADCFAELITQE